MSYNNSCVEDKSQKAFTEIVSNLNPKDYNGVSASGATVGLGWTAVVFALCCSIPTIYFGMKARDTSDKRGKAIFYIPLFCGFCVPLGCVIAMIFTARSAGA